MMTTDKANSGFEDKEWILILRFRDNIWESRKEHFHKCLFKNYSLNYIHEKIQDVIYLKLVQEGNVDNAFQ